MSNSLMRLLTAAALLLAGIPATADSIPPVSPEAVRAHVEFLADDLLEGRTAGSRGYDIAARYVATQFGVMGLKPAGESGSWMQNVPLLESTRVIPAGQFVIERAGERLELVPAEDFLPGHSFFGSDASVAAPAVFVGYGVYAPELQHDDFGGVDVHGKIAVVLNGAPASFPHDQRAHYSAGRTKNAELVRRGAVGVVSLNTPENEKRVPWSRVAQMSWRPQMRIVDAAGQPIDAYPELKATAALNLASAAKLFAGSPRSLEQIWESAARGEPQSFDLPAKITLRAKSALGRARSANVVGMLPGSDPKLAGEYVVLTAHLDHVGRGAPVNGDAIYNGALDNASGVAVMLETARALTQSRVRPRRSVLFVAVTAEERGLLGSDYFAQHPTVPQQAIVADVNMDMPTMLWPAASFTVFGAEHSTLGEAARTALKAEGFTMSPDEYPEEVIFIRSDQYSFVRQGIPSIYVDTGNSSTDPSVDVKARLREFRQTHYHLPSDQADLPIHYPSYARLVRVEARIVLSIANNHARPQWLPGDFFGETYGRPKGR